MLKWLRWPLVALGIVLGLFLLATVIGYSMPASHRATRSARFSRAPEEVWVAIADIRGQPSWRREITRAERLPDRNGHEVWRESDASGSGVAFETLESVPPVRLVRRIVDDSLPFGGTWTMVLTPEGDGTRLAVTEEGVVRNAFFRFLVRVVIGYGATADAYLRALGTKFGEEVTPR